MSATPTTTSNTTTPIENYKSWTPPTKFAPTDLVSEGRLLELLLQQAESASTLHLNHLITAFAELGLSKQTSGGNRFIRTTHAQFLPHFNFKDLQQQPPNTRAFQLEVRIVQAGKSSLNWEYRVFVLTDQDLKFNRVSNPDQLLLIANLQVATVFVKKIILDEASGKVVYKSTTGAYQHPGMMSPSIIDFKMDTTSSPRLRQPTVQDRPKGIFVNNQSLVLTEEDCRSMSGHVVNARLTKMIYGYVMQGLALGGRYRNNRVNSLQLLKGEPLSTASILNEVKLYFDEEVRPELGDLMFWSWLESTNDQEGQDPQLVIQTQIAYKNPATGKEGVACWSRMLLKKDGVVVGRNDDIKSVL